jgi:hypothetical protein
MYVNWIWCLIFIRYVDLVERWGDGEEEEVEDVEGRGGGARLEVGEEEGRGMGGKDKDKC